MKNLSQLAFAACVSAHVVITYPGWRGNNLDADEDFPYGKQFTYPCGGMGLSRNRTYWPISGGAVSFEPGWRRGHEKAVGYINLGIGTEGPDHGPKNMSFPMVHEFKILGPTNEEYDGQICLPSVALPEGLEINVGDNATIQVVEIAQHGAALYSCVDIEFVEDDDERIPEITESNCHNSSEIDVERIISVSEDEGVAYRSQTLGWTSISTMALLLWML